MPVRYQPTPNPNAGKFVVGRQVVEGDASRSYYSADQASANPLAAALFEIDGVQSLFMVEDFVTVMKATDADWSTLVPRVTSAIEGALP